MAKQLKQPNLTIQGQAGYCLSVQDDVWGVPHQYPKAIDAWNASGADNHPGAQPPSDVAVVVYWSFYDRTDGVQYGHIAAWVPGKGVFSSPFDKSYGNQWFDSIQAVTNRINRISGANSSYLGWSESLSGVKLVDMSGEVVATNQRQVTNADGVNGRAAASTDAAIVKTYEKGDVLTFKGFVKGQDPYGKGNNIWFVGAYSDTYWYSGAFNDPSTNGLSDLTPAPTPEPTPEPTPAPAPRPADDASYHIVVNKKHPNDPLDYAPSDLTTFKNGQKMRKAAFDMVAQMQIDSGDNVTIIPQSAYRSYADQEVVYNNYDPATRDTFSARPGFSEHQTGLAVDFQPIDATFAQSAAYTWLQENAHKYGFVLRYPDGQTATTGYQFEPWHWRYLGTDAQKYHDAGATTVEDFYGVSGGDYEPTPDPIPTPEPAPTPTPTPDPITEPWWKPILRAILAIIGIKI